MNELHIHGIHVSDGNIVHNSAKERFRSPLGAVPCGTRVRLSLVVVGLGFRNAWVSVIEGGGIREYDLSPDDVVLPTSAGGAQQVFLSAHVETPPQPAVLWYWFSVRLADGSVVCYGTDAHYVGQGEHPQGNSGTGKVYLNEPPAFQLTVHDPSFRTPDWAKGAILYQIFPDRYRRSAKDRVLEGLAWHHAHGRMGLRLHGHWDELPDFEARPGMAHYEPTDLFGGDLPGI
ncbi:MAG: hypothetical protein LBD12_00650, partial [Clostridiales Family XIII bacterium]|nr:hypothetical protein [Clostridiales Family XIII bacterium]